MFMAASPAFNAASFGYFDIVVVVWLIVGIARGRGRGMTQEILPTMQWLAIMVLAGLFYFPLSAIIFQSTSGAFNHLWSRVAAYVLIAFAVHLVFVWLNQTMGEKLKGSDYFGRAEYYMGMLSGLVRFACIVVVLCALMHSRIYTKAELAETEKMQKKNFEDIRFPTYGSVQQAVLVESFTGRLIEDNLATVLITSDSGRKPLEAFAKKQNDANNTIIASPKK
jgi:uncharacterized membrane protein required for colicin V production